MILTNQPQDSPAAEIGLNLNGDFNVNLPTGRAKVFPSIRAAAKYAVGEGFGFKVDSDELDTNERAWVNRFIAGGCQ